MGVAGWAVAAGLGQGLAAVPGSMAQGRLAVYHGAWLEVRVLMSPQPDDSLRRYFNEQDTGTAYKRCPR
ncbi:hypothetical protein [Microvirga brassicacearum]|uniref:Uncharacterized protein n=1 Tax=Microvirga brassicacearum TaxID=2580413 RepID=A0A5N3PFV1_9HYPH|nr:hypothetical protein [Microvirga brassicacearum]KAB0268610.1 hypothetical protein FEZ63_03980 [Microvirga brassicacearum]